MLKPNYALDFPPILLPLFMGEGIEDSETKPFLGFRLICPLSPWERVRERAVSRRLTFRFLSFAKNLLKGRLKGCLLKRLRTLKTSETNFAKTER